MNKALDSEVQEWLERRANNEGTQPCRAPKLSVVIPAFNEQWRLPTTLIDIIDYLDRAQPSYEVLVVDDGSSDKTLEMAEKFAKIRPQVKLLSYKPNRGKGHAVKTGMLAARGERVLFADADGSTPIRELERLSAALDSGAVIAIGSRALSSSDTEIKTSWYRKYPGRVFNFCVNTFLLPNFADTQCGFKLFTREVAGFLFGKQRSEKFSFDIEILYLARKANLTIAEVPINWSNCPGSKVNLILDSLQMLRDLFVFRVWHHKVSALDFENYKSDHAR